jgi:hypothetical protein
MLKPIAYKNLTIEQVKQVEKTLSVGDDAHEFAYFVGNDGKVQVMGPQGLLHEIARNVNKENKNG